MKLWIARDKDGTLCISDERPTLNVSKTCWLTSWSANYIFIADELFPEVTLENSPQEVELKFVHEL